MRKVAFAFAAAAALSVAAPASAAVYIVDFTIGNLPTTHSGTATLTTSGDASAGMTLVTALTGTIDGHPIDLMAVGTFPQDPSNDNLFTTASPYFTLGGIAFMVNDFPTFPTQYNIYSQFGLVLTCVNGQLGEGGCNKPTIFSVRADNGAVPEPSTWAMMLLGFAAIGFAARRRRVSALA